MPEVLIFSIDGAARGNPGPAGVGVAVLDSKGKVLKEIAVSIGETTNNVAEYSALLCALFEAASAQAKKVNVQTDSELLARQINGEYRVKDPTLKVLHSLCMRWMDAFSSCKVSHIPREKNKIADRLANRAVDSGLKQQRTSKSAGSASAISQQLFPFGPA